MRSFDDGYWMHTAIERIKAGESETECLADYGYIRESIRIAETARADTAEARLAEVAELVYGDICECNRIPDGGYPEQCLVCSLKQVLSEQTSAT